MEKIGNMVPVEVIATNICMNFGDSDRKYFGEHMTNIIATYSFLHIYISDRKKVKSIIITPDGVNNLPCDFIRETKLGIINAHGRIATMSLDRNLRVAPKCRTRADVESALTAIDCGDAPKDCYSFYNIYDPERNYIGERRGYACAINELGYFNVDRENQTITVSSDFPENENMIMEYISDGVSEGLELVPFEFMDCITKGAKSRFLLDKGDKRWKAFDEQYETAGRNIIRLYGARPISMWAQLFKTII